MFWKIFIRKKKKKLPKEATSRLDSNAVGMVRTLQDEGFESYLVGGCVRDLMLSQPVKDFDISTQATPQQVKSLVKRSQIIGRRFRIVLARRSPKRELKESGQALFPKVQLSHEPLEYQITTFRRSPEMVDGKLNENVYGSAKEDAARRDFTINGLFLDPSDMSVLDFVGGLDDMEKKQIRMIGDPVVRFEEDTIRIYRALRFASRTGFHLEKNTRKALIKCVPLLKDAKKERVREEVLKIWKEPATVDALRLFDEFKIWKTLSPLFAKKLSSDSDYVRKLEDMARATNEFPWPYEKMAAPFFALMAHDHLLLGHPNEKRKYVELFTALNISKKENEDLERLKRNVAKLGPEKDEKLEKKILKAGHHHWPSLVQSFWVLRIMAHAEIEDFPARWKCWEETWMSLRKHLLRESHSGRSAPRPRTRHPSRRRGTKKRSR